MLVLDNLDASKQAAPSKQATRFRARSGFMTCTSSPKMGRTVTSACSHRSGAAWYQSLMKKFSSKELE